MSIGDITKSNGIGFAFPPDDIIFGQSPAMRGLRPLVEQIARAPLPILIYGGTGAGKEVLSGFIHRHSPRKDGPQVKISCAAIPTTLLEAEMFGYEQGAFTGAYTTKPGLVEQAHTGTLVLDHLSELDPLMQAKLLQLLQDGTFCRVGGQQDLKIDTRLICITTRNPEEEVAEGKLRLDLFHRINTSSIRVPDLQERPEDISAIAGYLVQSFNQMFGTNAAPLSPAVHRIMRQYRWPGNIRQLENVIRRYVVLGYPETIAEDISRHSYTFHAPHLPATQSLTFKARTEQLVREVETQAILRVLHLNNWNRRKTAQVLNISYRALLYKIRNAGLGDYSPSKRTSRQTGTEFLNYRSIPEA